MTHSLILEPPAQADIETAIVWYDEQRLGLGDRFRDELYGLLTRIRDRPGSFPALVQPIRRGLLRKFPYSVYFVLDATSVSVIAVLHQRRDPSAWQTRLDAGR